jgi:hypothetical protein
MINNILPNLSTFMVNITKAALATLGDVVTILILIARTVQLKLITMIVISIKLAPYVMQELFHWLTIAPHLRLLAITTWLSLRTMPYWMALTKIAQQMRLE